MKKYYIPYELSQRMVKLGFSEKCFDLHGDTPSGKITNNLLYNGRTPKIIWDQAFDWFRENKSLHSCLDITISSRWFYFIYNLKSKRNSEVAPCDNNLSYNVYEEARQACLERLIEIVENEKTE